MNHKNRLLVFVFAASLLLSPVAVRAGEIHEAAAAGDVASVLALLDRDPSLLNTTDDDELTPLSITAREGQIDLARELIAQGADIRLGDVDKTGPIHFAAIGGSSEGIDLLLSHGISIDEQDNNGSTALIFALSYRKFETAARLIEAGADPTIANNRDVTPLHYAALRGAHDLAQQLIDQGADVNALTGEHATALHFAAVWADDPEMTKLLLESGADTEIRDDYGRTPLCLTARETGNADMGRLLIDHGADINAKDRFDDTPLTLVTWRGFSRFVNLLLDRGVEVPFQGRKGEYLTLFAAKRRLDRLFTVLIEGGADLTIRNDCGGSLLHSAAKGGSVEIVRSLGLRGLPISERDTYGWTPLHYAAEKGRIEVTRWLVAQGAEIDGTTLSGRTVHHLAETNGRKDVALLLREKGADDLPPVFPALRGPYLGQPLPGDDPVPFALDIVSTNHFEHATVAFSPDGKEAFWSSSFEPDSGYSYSRIWTARVKKSGRWTAPEIAWFSTVPRMGDDVPHFHPDGSSVFFLSERPDEPGGERAAARIWVMERVGSGWSEPRPIEGGPNNRGLHWQFSVTEDGDIYFGSDGGHWVSRHLSGFRYSEAEKLPAVINNDEYRDDSPCIAHDESYFLFVGCHRPDAPDRGDIYISFRNRQGEWTEPVNAGETINTDSHEQCPMLSHDGKYLFFKSNRTGSTDIYWMDAGFIEKLRPEWM